MEIINKNCKFHNLQANNICTQDFCKNKYLCDICLNLHPKDHKYLVSVSSINLNSFEKLIEINEENFKPFLEKINSLNLEYVWKIETDINNMIESYTNILMKAKQNLLYKLELIKDNFIEESKLWTKMKINYNQEYIKILNEINVTKKDSIYSSASSNELIVKDSNLNSSLNDFNFEDFDNKNNSLFAIINTFIEKHTYYSKETETPILLEDYTRSTNDTINEEVTELTLNLTKFIENKTKLIYVAKNHQMNSNKSENSFDVTCKSDNYLSSNLVISANCSPRVVTNFSLDTYSSNIVEKNITPCFKKDDYFKKSNFEEEGKSQPNSPLTSHKRNLSNSFNSHVNNSNLLSNSSFKVNPLISVLKFSTNNFNPKNLTIDNPLDVFLEKKGCWYTLEYIEELDYIICGYQTGEIIIFKEVDLTPVKTFRPRFKKIRKLVYSHLNSSIFASYDDGYIVVIYLTDYKIEHFKMSSSQIYSLEILQNHNILIFGGAEKNISYTQIVDMNKIYLFYDSSDGEVQSLLYDDKRDILVAAFRKKSLIFFKYLTREVLLRYEFEGKDNCGMVLKKYKDEYILTSGYFINIHLFKFINNNEIELVHKFEMKYHHFYDICQFYDSYCLVSTYDEGSIILVDIDNKKLVKKFSGFKGVVQIKIIKNHFYLTSHSENLKKVSFKDKI